MASIAVRGGFLLIGVEEDKAAHTFSVVDVDLHAGIAETIDSVARSRITPPLAVVPTALANQPGSVQGLLVIEVPESPDTPHMVAGVYYGRSATGKVPLDDDEVERLILRRGRTEDRLRAAIAGTKQYAAQPATVVDNGHFFLTVVPTAVSGNVSGAHPGQPGAEAVSRPLHRGGQQRCPGRRCATPERQHRLRRADGPSAQPSTHAAPGSVESGEIYRI